MAIHRLQLDDFVSVDYELVAIHSPLEDHRLAYFINRSLGILLQKCPKEISLRAGSRDSRFTCFTYEDPESETAWHLVQNRSAQAASRSTDGVLFGEEAIATTSYLLPEFKKTDYILKVENTPSFFALEKVTDSLLNVKQITTAYKIDHHKLKSKNNLIF